jgi:hypothetical protein
MEENIKQNCTNAINGIYAEIENKIDFSQSKLQVQLQRANLRKEFMENAGDKCAEIINSNYSEKEKASNIIKFVKETINQKSNELLGF